MSENKNVALMADPETATLKRCCNIPEGALKLCSCGSSGGGEVSLCILNSVPETGAGPATATKAVISSTGDIVTTGEPFPVVVPRIYHLKS